MVDKEELKKEEKNKKEEIRKKEEEEKNIKEKIRKKEKEEKGKKEEERKKEEEDLAEVEKQKKIKMDQDKNKGAIHSTVKGLTLVNTPIHVSTPLSLIPRNFSYSSQLIKIEDVVVVVGDYYYDNTKRGI